MTGQSISDAEKATVAQGADEIDLVNSGLEETMTTAYDALREIYMTTEGIKTLRIAGFVSAINKIATIYRQMGIFP